MVLIDDVNTIDRMGWILGIMFLASGIPSEFTTDNSMIITSRVNLSNELLLTA
jgi:hypothetical protein